MIERNDILSLSYLKKAAFSGSYQGMRYLLRMQKGGERNALQVFCWAEPFSFDATGDEEKCSREFDFSEEGILQGIDWLNESWAERREEFGSAKENWDQR